MFPVSQKRNLTFSAYLHTAFLAFYRISPKDTAPFTAPRKNLRRFLLFTPSAVPGACRTSKSDACKKCRHRFFILLFYGPRPAVFHSGHGRRHSCRRSPGAFCGIAPQAPHKARSVKLKTGQIRSFILSFGSIKRPAAIAPAGTQGSLQPMPHRFETAPRRLPQGWNSSLCAPPQWPRHRGCKAA